MFPSCFLGLFWQGLACKLDVAGHKATLSNLNLSEVGLATSETGHLALEVSQFPNSRPPSMACKATDEVWIPNTISEQYTELPATKPPKTLFYPKKISKVVQNLLEEKGLFRVHPFLHGGNQQIRVGIFGWRLTEK